MEPLSGIVTQELSQPLRTTHSSEGKPRAGTLGGRDSEAPVPSGPKLTGLETRGHFTGSLHGLAIPRVTVASVVSYFKAGILFHLIGKRSICNLLPLCSHLVVFKRPLPLPQHILHKNYLQVAQVYVFLTANN